MGDMKSKLKNSPSDEVATKFIKQTERGKTPVISLFINRLPKRHSLFMNSTIDATA